MRIRFEVSLDMSNEIDFKSLKNELLKVDEQEAVPVEQEAIEPKDDEEEPPILPARGSRAKFNIIEHLEQRYGKGGYLDMKDSVVRSNVDHDDLYDSDDSFIDDTDLHESIESTYFKTQVKTKHSGFFVNAGDRIETVKETKAAALPLARESEKDKDNEPIRKKSKKNNEEIDDWSDEWHPGAEIEQVVATFREFVTKYFEEHGVTKSWPPALDDQFRAVDKAVVAAHPQRWRVNGYIANLMQFLPYTKTTLRGHMVRLEARDHARQMKEEADELFKEMEALILVHTNRANQSDCFIVDAFKEDVLKDINLAKGVYNAVSKMEEWVTKENEYRQLLKQEDKKHLEEADTVALSVQKERNRLNTKILGLFPINSIDVAFVRELLKIGRKESGHTSTPHTTPSTKKTGSGTNTSTGAKKPVKATKQSADKSSEAKAPAVPGAKKPAKPLKSRRFEVCPIWSAQDFMEKKTLT
ncbi:hypothetical protein THRCLA_11628 [Thraustotheca clavata]|uniref:Hpc2-related domain-containing protein n=1 Tax=Thraustotheca clavata TaxID=74557 RepID=A0A1V9Y733_9STRA|nr:hypothetical protein THRCLA_11628 [Thraustotheca clavata]